MHGTSRGRELGLQQNGRRRTGLDGLRWWIFLHPYLVTGPFFPGQNERPTAFGRN